MKNIKEYFIVDECFKCHSSCLEITSKSAYVQKIEIIGLPHLFCRECNTYFLSGDLIEKIERVIQEKNIDSKRIDFNQIWVEEKNEVN